MVEGQSPSVKSEPTSRVCGCSIARVTNHGTTQPGQMNANLMFPARLKSNFNQRVPTPSRGHAIMAHRPLGVLAAPIARSHPEVAAFREEVLDSSLAWFRYPLNHRQIRFAHPIPVLLEPIADFRTASEEQQAGRFPVEAMNHEWPPGLHSRHFRSCPLSP